MSEVHIKINNLPITADTSMTVLEAAQKAGIHIPTLCYLKGLNKTGACRVCLVEVKGAKTLGAACVYPLSEGMEVFTHSEKAIQGRKNSVELLMSNHNKNCLSCKRNQNCELQSLAQELNIRDNAFEGEHTPPTIDNFGPGIVRDTSKCVLCGRCIQACKMYQGLGVLGFENRGFKTKVGPAFDASFSQVNCMQCGQCVNVCPVGALTEKESIHEVIQALQDPEKHVIVQTAPAVRASLAEEFGYPIGTRCTGKMAAALRRVGFDRVYDTNFGADLTIMEEGTEFIHRFQSGGVLPMITSCSPGWVRYAEFEYPEILDHLSTCKSPHMMLGAMLKSYYAETKGLDPQSIYVVSVMPCTAKKTEIVKKENVKANGIQDVDAVLTTRECARLLRFYGIDFDNLPDEPFDQDMFGEYSGAGAIFGNTGGVMEAALRTVKEVLEKKPLDQLEFKEVRGLMGIKEATLSIAGTEVKVAVASGMAMASKLLDQVKEGTSPYHFIEIMGCPGGCINGGGQSYVKASIRNTMKEDYRLKRAQALYDEDEALPVRKSHENSQIQQLYQNYLKEPGSEKAHELLHTHYTKKDRFKMD